MPTTLQQIIGYAAKLVRQLVYADMLAIVCKMSAYCFVTTAEESP
jgi:hypothetical protein